MYYTAPTSDQPTNKPIADEEVSLNDQQENAVHIICRQTVERALYDSTFNAQLGRVGFSNPVVGALGPLKFGNTVITRLVFSSPDCGGSPCGAASGHSIHQNSVVVVIEEQEAMEEQQNTEA